MPNREGAVEVVDDRGAVGVRVAVVHDGQVASAWRPPARATMRGQEDAA